jgi:RNA polymerase-associated protein CTR9
MGVLYQQLTNYEMAEKFYRMALFGTGDSETNEQDKEGKDYEPLYSDATKATTLFNLARLYEEKGETKRAESMYSALLKAHPEYIDCQLRLGLIKRNQGNFIDAEYQFKEAQQPGLVEPILMHGDLQSSRGEWKAARRSFCTILLDKERPQLRHDSYAMISYANVFLNTLHDNFSGHLTQAQEIYVKVITQEPFNIYAANGLGIVMASMGEYHTAKEIFNQVRESATDASPNPWVNLAHVFMETSSWEKAVDLYTNCNKKFFGGKNVELLTYTAKAYFEWRKFKEAIAVLRKAIHISPWNEQLWFNLALAQEEMGVKNLQAGSKAEVEDEFVAVVDRGAESLATAVRVFESLVVNTKNAKSKDRVDVGTGITVGQSFSSGFKTGSSVPEFLNETQVFLCGWGSAFLPSV